MGSRRVEDPGGEGPMTVEGPDPLEGKDKASASLMARLIEKTRRWQIAAAGRYDANTDDDYLFHTDDFAGFGIAAQLAIDDRLSDIPGEDDDWLWGRRDGKWKGTLEVLENNVVTSDSLEGVNFTIRRMYYRMGDNPFDESAYWLMWLPRKGQWIVSDWDD